jgi:acetyltransferase
VAPTADEAVTFSAAIGYPVVLKLHSRTVTHKTDVGGVELNLKTEHEVRAAFDRIRAGVTAKAGEAAFEGVTVQPMVKIKDAYELILGSSADPQFGPVLLFGSGGQLVEVYEDSALGLPPLNSVLARRLMERTKINKALDGVRGRKPVDRAQLEQIVVRFSQLIAEQRRIKEADINPLLAGPEAIVALDGRIVLHDWSIRDEDLPRTAIRAYPRRYVKQWETRNGVPVTMRPIRPEDEPALAEFHRTLSERSVYMRYFYQLSLSQRVSHERLTRICHSDYAREMVLVVEAADGALLAVGRLTRQHGANSAEFALLVGDPWQDSGLGTELLTTLLAIAREEKIARVTGNILPDNRPMLEICKALGFALEFDRDEGVVIAGIDI